MSQLIRVVRNQDSIPLMDIIFVHGLNGHPIEAWSAESTDSLWLTWLAEDLPEVQVWTLSYEASASSWSGTALPLFDQASNILAELGTEDLGSRPICFVAHSMGGLLVKQILRNAYLSSEFRPFTTQVRGIIFLATPHTGSDVATLASYLKFFTRSTIAVTELEAHAARLRELNLWFRQTVRDLRIRIQVYFETLPTNGLLLVNQSTADPGLEDVYPVPIETDHRHIAKPSSRDDLVYKRTLQFVQRMLLEPGEVREQTPSTVSQLSTGTTLNYMSGALPGRRLKKQYGLHFLRNKLPDLTAEMRDHQELSLIMMDIDELTIINKHYNSPVGDSVIVTVARILYFESGTPYNGRCGDDTYYVLLPGFDIQRAIKTSERLRSLIIQHPWESLALDLRVTCSFGIAQLQKGEPVADWVIRASIGFRNAKRRPHSTATIIIEGKFEVSVELDGISVGPQSLAKNHPRDFEHYWS